MTDEQRPGAASPDGESESLGPTNLGSSAAEAGSVYGDRGPTASTTEGAPVSLDAGESDVDTESDQGPSVGDVYRGGQ